MKRKICCILLVALIGVQAFAPVMVGAENKQINIQDSADSDAVALLRALGVIEIDNNTGLLWDNSLVKRSEIAKIICNLSNVETTKDEIPKFKDVSEEDRAYVETIVRLGYMNGYNKDEFGPDDCITNAQTVKILVSMLGGSAVAEMIGGYPMGYYEAARKLGLMRQFNGGIDEFTRRIDVINLIYVAIHLDVLTVKSVTKSELDVADYSVTYGTGEMFLTQTHDIYRVRGVMDRNDNTGLSYGTSGVNEKCVSIDSNVYSDPNDLCYDFLGCDVVAYVKIPEKGKGTVLFIEEGSENKTIDFTEEAQPKYNASKRELTYYENDRSRTITIAPNVDMIYNGQAIKFDSNKINSLKYGDVKIIDNNGDKVYDVINVKSYDICIVESVDTNGNRLFVKHNGTPLNFEDCNVRIFKDGKPAELKNLKPNDTLMIVKAFGTNAKIFEIHASSITVKGTVSTTSEENGKKIIQISDEEYVIGYYADEKVADRTILELSPRDTVVCYIDIRGEVQYYEISSSSEQVGYYIDAAFKKTAFSAEGRAYIYSESGSFKYLTIGETLVVDGKKVKTSDIMKGRCAAFNPDERTACLVKFVEQDGVLKKITFPKPTYDKDAFSMNVSVTNEEYKIKSILAGKYFTDDTTKFFMVPSANVPNDVKHEPSSYWMVGSNPFALKSSYSYDIYDTAPNQAAKYVVLKNDPRYKKYGSMIVCNVGAALNESGDALRHISGYTYNKTDVSYYVRDDAIIKKMLPGKTSSEMTELAEGDFVSIGDVVFLSIDGNGEVYDVKILHRSETVDANYASQIGDNWNYHAYTHALEQGYFTFGEVVKNNGSQLAVCATGAAQPSENYDYISAIICDSGSTVMRYNSNRNTLEFIEFGEVYFGDKVFAYVTPENRTSYLIVYE